MPTQSDEHRPSPQAERPPSAPIEPPQPPFVEIPVPHPQNDLSSTEAEAHTATGIPHPSNSQEYPSTNAPKSSEVADQSAQLSSTERPASVAQKHTKSTNKKSSNARQLPLPFPLTEGVKRSVPHSKSRKGTPNSVDEFFAATVSTTYPREQRSRSQSSSILPFDQISCIGCYDESGKPGNHTLPALPNTAQNNDDDAIQCGRCDRWSHVYCIRTQWGVPEDLEDFWMCQVCRKLAPEEEVLWNDET